MKADTAAKMAMYIKCDTFIWIREKEKIIALNILNKSYSSFILSMLFPSRNVVYISFVHTTLLLHCRIVVYVCNNKKNYLNKWKRKETSKYHFHRITSKFTFLEGVMIDKGAWRTTSGNA